MKHLGLLTLLVGLVLTSVMHSQTTGVDPCSVSKKTSTPFSISTGDFQLVIAGVTGKQIYVCNVVFSGSASSGFNINFAGSSSGCNSGFTFLGTLRPNNNAVVSAGGGNSTQFAVPQDNAFCIELGGATPLESSGWVVYVQK